jgi:hypothetical protein
MDGEDYAIYNANSTGTSLVPVSSKVFDYKKDNMSTDREKGRGNKRATRDKRIAESKARQKTALHCA